MFINFKQLKITADIIDTEEFRRAVDKILRQFKEYQHLSADLLSEKIDRYHHVLTVDDFRINFDIETLVRRCIPLSKYSKYVRSLVCEKSESFEMMLDFEDHVNELTESKQNYKLYNNIVSLGSDPFSIYYWYVLGEECLSAMLVFTVLIHLKFIEYEWSIILFEPKRYDGKTELYALVFSGDSKEFKDYIISGTTKCVIGDPLSELMSEKEYLSMMRCKAKMCTFKRYTSLLSFTAYLDTL
jgi:hypothetical protein